MTFWRFLKYEKPYLLLTAAQLLVMSMVFYFDPRMSWQWDSFLYAFALSSLLLGAFFIYRYMRSSQAIRRMHEEDTTNLSLEAEAYRLAMEQMEKQHIRTMNLIHEKQNEYYNFIVTWFHEIKTPIAVLRLIQKTEANAQSIDEEITRIEHYVDQALYYAKLDSFNQDYSIVSCDLERLMKNVVKQHSKTFFSKNIRVVLHTEPISVQSDSKWLQFIINQLLTNSLKYTESGGEITIQTRMAAKEKQLIIRDGGIGIEPQDLPRIFNLGFTGTNGRIFTKSTGMGLYLAQELSKKLGHYITCSSVSGTGSFTEMTIHFPNHDDPFLSTLKDTDRPT
ncbi:sensor histidine kinase [Marinicrinis lubricantis]|uniref:histidine kinase n=1 Tax=Marinicrinis lubricantis TaxID=2086470 RepID=A0ABW1IV43_9BACL